MGARQHGNAPRYDVTSGAKWRPNPTLEPAEAVKLYRAMDALNTSASGVIKELIARIDFDERGMPIWADTDEPIGAEIADAVQSTLIDLSEVNQRAA